ncbi:hypothetical protein ABPG74_006684 [Tetrahymena malaccensis]
MNQKNTQQQLRGGSSKQKRDNEIYSKVNEHQLQNNQQNYNLSQGKTIQKGIQQKQKKINEFAQQKNMEQFEQNIESLNDEGLNNNDQNRKDELDSINYQLNTFKTQKQYQNYINSIQDETKTKHFTDRRQKQKTQQFQDEHQKVNNIQTQLDQQAKTSKKFKNHALKIEYVEQTVNKIQNLTQEKSTQNIQSTQENNEEISSESKNQEKLEIFEEFQTGNKKNKLIKLDQNENQIKNITQKYLLNSQFSKVSNLNSFNDFGSSDFTDQQGGCQQNSQNIKSNQLIKQSEEEQIQELEQNLNKFLEILLEKQQEIQKFDLNDLNQERQKNNVQSAEQFQSKAYIQDNVKTQEQIINAENVYLSNEFEYSQFKQQGAFRYQSVKDNLFYEQKEENSNKKICIYRNEKNLNSESEKFLKKIFRLGDHINSGGEADIFIHADNENIAFRIIEVNEMEDFEEQIKELYNIKQLQEQNILDLNTSHVVEDKFNNNKFIIHVMQKCQMSLSDEIKSADFTLSQALNFISTAFNLLIALRQKYIYHSDIKPGNILKIGDDNYKLSDFGASQYVNFSDPFIQPKMWTRGFIPKNQQKNIPFYHDIYSFGKTIQIVLTKLKTHQVIKKELENLISNMLCKDDKNSIKLDCFELPSMLINSLQNLSINTIKK